MSTKIKDYNYELPQEKIAKYPQEKRDESKLLIYKNGKISDDKFYNLDIYLQSGSLMIFNNTKVIKARIFFYKSTGAEIEILLLEPADGKTYEEAVGDRWKMTAPMPEAVKKIAVMNVNEVEKVAAEVDFVFSAVDMTKEEIKKIEEEQ